jgi:hypothetical protein
MFDNPMSKKIADFLLDIGLKVKSQSLGTESFLPGIRIEAGEMIVDESKLNYPGDLLHEAGHLALAPPHLRRLLDDKVELPGFNMDAIEAGTIAWSYAAGLHLDLAPDDVFHEGYRHDGLESLLTNFAMGVYLGANVLEDAGMTATGSRAADLGVEPYPKMLKWVRE